MNIVHYCLIGIAVVLFITPIINFTNKTVHRYKMRRRNALIPKLLDDVTRMICCTQLSRCKFPGVAKGIMSPPTVPSLKPGWKYYGDGISFIVANDDPNFICVTYGEKKILIWTKQNKKKVIWFFLDESLDITELKGAAVSSVKNLCYFTNRRHSRWLKASEKKVLRDKLKHRVTSLRQLDPETV